MKICITGATGFIGTNLAIEFQNSDEFDVYGIYNRRPPHKFIKKNNWIKSDLSDVHSLEKTFEGFDIIVMCAAVSSGAKNIINNPEIFVANNTTINQNTIVNAVKSEVKHIIFPSCSVMYQNSESIQGENDVSIENIEDKYVGGAAMKLYVEGLCKFYSLISKTKFSVIRHTNCIGPFDKFDPSLSHVFASVVVKSLSKTSNQIEIWGNGKEKRDFLYVNDLTRLINVLIDKQVESFELLCAGSSNLISITDLYHLAMKITGVKKELTYNLEKPSIPVNICLSHEKAKQKYGWVPEVSLEEGMKKVIEWVKKNGIVSKYSQ